MKTCIKKIKDTHGAFYFGEGNNRVCGKPATHGQLCRKHAHKGQFVVRLGETGPIVERFDTEKELVDASVNYQHFEYRFQKITNSSRRDVKIPDRNK